MKRNVWIVLGAIALVIIILVSTFKSTYNKLATLDEGAQKAWQDVEASYQRRMDLIPQLVSVVERSANFEKSTLTSVIRARTGYQDALAGAQATSKSVNPSTSDQATLDKFQQSQNQVASAGRAYLNVVFEQYPNLQTPQQYAVLTNQLEGTENRINMGRQKFNEAVQNYNTYRRKFPNNIIANFTDFQVRPYFKADAGAEKAVGVQDIFDRQDEKNNAPAPSIAPAPADQSNPTKDPSGAPGK